MIVRYQLTSRLACVWLAATMIGPTAPADDATTHAEGSVARWMTRLRTGRGLQYDAWFALEAIGKPAVPALVEALDDEAYKKARSSICRMLGKIGDKRAVEPLIRVVKTTKDDSLRGGAMSALGRLGPPAAAAIPVLTAALKDESSIIRVTAARAMHRIEPKTPRSTLVPLLIDVAGGDDWQASGSALSALAEVDGARALGVLVPYLKHPHKYVRGQAAQGLGSLGPKAREALPELIDALADVPADGAMLEVAKAVADVSRGDKQTVSTLIAIVQDPDDRRDRGAIRAARDMGTAGRAVVPAIVAAATDPKRHADVRKEAIEAIMTMAPKSPEVAEALLRLAADADKEMRKIAFWRLAQAKIDPALVVPVFVKGLASDDSSIRGSASRFLAREASKNRKVMGMLIDVLKKKGPDCVAVAAAMRDLGSGAKYAVPALIECLESKDAKVCYAAAFTLGRLGPITRKVVPALCAALKDPSTPNHGGIAQAIAMIGLPARAAIPTLIQVLTGDPEQGTFSGNRYHVFEALASMGPAAKDAAPAMVAMLTHEHRPFRFQAVRGLVAIGCADEHAEAMMPALREMLTETVPHDFRLERIRIARQLGPKAKPLLPTLIPMMKDDFGRIAEAAGDAIKAIAATRPNGTVK